VPGGAHDDLQELEVTRPDAAAATIAAHRDAFAIRELHAAWTRVIGLVVQPGVEFDHHKVIDYAPARARSLSAWIEREPALVYEAHSTDYQTPAALAALVRDHFAILKIGPGATFALRETLWGLADIEAEWLADEAGSRLKRTVIEVMHASPEHWRAYYADPERLRLDMQYSLSDRVRYYWAHPRVQLACAALLERLGRGPLPLTLLSQYLPWQHAQVRAGRLRNAVADILQEGVARVLRQYGEACSPARHAPAEVLQ
jgi:D-tagatose-1,6-bisphosphate aldolase subunit GatZ/KbaZ